MQDPYVTIGICTKNTEKTILKTLRSISELRYSKDLLEVIVVDGLSSDNTLQLVQTFFAESGLKGKVLFDKGLGLGWARQLIVNNSEGEFIAFVDADQNLDHLWLDVSLRDLQKYPTAAGVRSAQGLTYGLPFPGSVENYTKYFQERVRKTIRDLKIAEFGIGGSLFRKKTLVKVGGFNPKFIFASEDADLAARLIKSGWKIRSSRATHYHYSKSTWKALYKQYWNWGRGLALFVKRQRTLFGKLDVLRTIISLFGNLVLSPRLIIPCYTATREIFCILIPIQFAYKTIAWYIGYFLERVRSE